MFDRLNGGANLDWKERCGEKSRRLSLAWGGEGGARLKAELRLSWHATCVGFTPSIVVFKKIIKI